MSKYIVWQDGRVALLKPNGVAYVFPITDEPDLICLVGPPQPIFDWKGDFVKGQALLSMNDMYKQELNGYCTHPSARSTQN